MNSTFRLQDEVSLDIMEDYVKTTLSSFKWGLGTRGMLRVVEIGKEGTLDAIGHTLVYMPN